MCIYIYIKYNKNKQEPCICIRFFELQHVSQRAFPAPLGGGGAEALPFPWRAFVVLSSTRPNTSVFWGIWRES